MGLTYPDSKHERERAALDAGARYGIEVVVVNPGYVLGVPVNRARPCTISPRTIGNAEHDRALSRLGLLKPLTLAQRWPSAG